MVRIYHEAKECWSGEGNGHPLQCSCLENSLDRGAWWATVHRVAKSRTRLKRLSMQRVLERLELVVSVGRQSQVAVRNISGELSRSISKRRETNFQGPL